MNPPPADAMHKPLLDAEALVHRQGWDKPPMLVVIDTSATGRIGLLPLPLPDFMTPNKFLERMFAEPGFSKRFCQLIATSCYEFTGMAVIHEAWLMTTSSHAETTRLHNSGTSLKDQPGRKEARTIQAIDVYGRAWLVNRTRGEKPTVANTNDFLAGGRLFETLRRLILAVVKLQPGREELARELELMLITRMEDSATIAQAHQDRQQ